MAVSAASVWEVRTAGSINNGGGFATDAANFLTNGAATSGTGSAPVFTSASYTFVSGDIGAYVYIKSGTNWIPGWYKISSVSAGAATLDASVGAVLLATTGQRNTTAGIASTASPTSATFGVDYSQQSSPQFAVTGATTSGTVAVIAYASAAVNMVGNYIKIVSGTNFTVGWYQVISVSAGVSITVDRNCSSGAGSSGVFNIGGAVALPGNVTGIMDNGHYMWIKADGTYTLAASSAVFLQSNTAKIIAVVGYTTTRGDNGRASLTSSTNSVNFFQSADTLIWGYVFKNLSMSHTAVTRGIAISLSNFGDMSGVNIHNCLIDGFNIGVYCQRGCKNFVMAQSEVKNCAVHGVQLDGNTGHDGSATFLNCWIHANGAGLTYNPGDGALTIVDCVFQSNTADGVHAANTVTGAAFNMTFVFVNSAFISNTGDGFEFDSGGGVTQAMLLATNCVFYGNGGYGAKSDAVQQHQFFRNCAFGSNTSGNRTGWSAEASDVTLTGSPFASSTDFNLNSTAGAGAACKQAGYPTTVGS